MSEGGFSRRFGKWRDKLEWIDELAVEGVLRWQSLVRAEERNPYVGAVIRAVVVGAITVAALPLPQRSGHDGDASTIALKLAILAAASLVVRPRSPYLALALTVGCGVAYIAVTGSFNTAMDLPVAVAMASVTAAVRPSAGVAVTAAAWMTLLIASFVFGDSWLLVERLGLVGWVILGGVLGGIRQYHRRHVADVQLQARITATLLRVEADNLVTQERLRIARELHDVVAHHVATVSLQVGSANNLLPDRPSDAKAMLSGIEKNARSAMAELKQVVGVLRTCTEEGSGIARASIADLERLVDVFRECGARIEVTVLGEPEVLTASADVAAYRTVQEALSNAIRHAPESPIEIELSNTPESVRIRVANSLVSTTESDHTDENSGYGLSGMRERVELAGGYCEAGVLGGRFVVEAGFPTRRALRTDSQELDD